MNKLAYVLPLLLTKVLAILGTGKRSHFGAVNEHCAPRGWPEGSRRFFCFLFCPLFSNNFFLPSTMWFTFFKGLIVGMQHVIA